MRECGDGVEEYNIGDEVFGFVSLMRLGGFADYVIALPEELARKPKTITHAEAAAIPVAGETSWQALFDEAQLGPGQWLLIHAAAGGVGSIAVQLAKAKGAYVIATASAANEEFVSSLGVDEFIDYRTTRFDEALRDIDVVYDTIGGETQARSFSVLKPRGYLVSIVEPPAEELAMRFKVRAAMTVVQPNGAQLANIAALVEEGKVRPSVAKTMPLEDAVAALMESKQGHVRGKLVLVP